MKDMIIKEKARKKEMLSESIAITTKPAEVTQVLSLVDLTEKYM